MDQLAQSEFNLSTEILMESAGALSAEDIIFQFNEEPVLVLCGPGHNGGDGLVLARHLLSTGRIVQIFCSKKSATISEVQKKRLRDQGVLLQDLENVEQIKKTVQAHVQKKIVIVDAHVWCGFMPECRGFVFGNYSLYQFLKICMF